MENNVWTKLRCAITKKAAKADVKMYQEAGVQRSDSAWV